MRKIGKTLFVVSIIIVLCIVILDFLNIQPDNSIMPEDDIDDDSDDYYDDDPDGFYDDPYDFDLID